MSKVIKGSSLQKLIKRLIKYCKVNNLQVYESPTMVSCIMPLGHILTIYRKPETLIGWQHLYYYYGKIRYPKDYVKIRNITESGAKQLYKKLGELLNEKE